MNSKLRFSGFALAIAMIIPSIAYAQSASPAVASGDSDYPWLDNDWYKVHLNLRARIELADFDLLKKSESYTLRTRAGIETKPLYGISSFIELENTWSLNEEQTFDGVSAPNGRSPIVDPENTELNQAYLEYASSDLLGTPVDAKVRGGKQRIIFDDARFIGNVTWRQNEQTFDAVLGQSGFSVDGLTAQYVHIWNVQRIFGDRGPTPATSDFKSDSHLARINFAGIEDHDLTAFAYFLDFEDEAPALSSNSYGFRAAGSFPLEEDWSLAYSASYAYQVDAGDNSVDYKAHYVWSELSATWKRAGTLGVGFELLGSDDGTAVFVTPLATAHKFNGFADTFLTNGGPTGLQDLFVSVAPTLPLDLKGKLVYHEFWADHGNTHLGRELDAVVSRAISRNWTGLIKGAWFDGDDTVPLLVDRWRLTFDATFTY